MLPELNIYISSQNASVPNYNIEVSTEFMSIKSASGVHKNEKQSLDIENISSLSVPKLGEKHKSVTPRGSMKSKKSDQP